MLDTDKVLNRLKQLEQEGSEKLAEFAKEIVPALCLELNKTRMEVVDAILKSDDGNKSPKRRDRCLN